MVAHIFNSSIQNSVSSRLVRATQRVLGEVELHRETLLFCVYPLLPYPLSWGAGEMV